MADIKSAFECAMERVEGLGEASAEDKVKWKHVPEGEKLAARYLKNECNLARELAKYEPVARRYVTDGATETLIRNIDLPRSEFLKVNTERAMEGIRVLRGDNTALESVLDRIRYVINHFEQDGAQQRKQAYEALKSDFRARIERALQQRTGISLEMNVDVEREPQFQEEWRATLAQLDSQYYKLLDEYKEKLRAIAWSGD